MATTDIDLAKLPSPRIFLFRMLVFVVLCGLVAYVLQVQILRAFLANPWLNGLIIGVFAAAAFHWRIFTIPVSWQTWPALIGTI